MGALAVELLFHLDAEGAFIHPMALIFAMEITEWYLFSSVAIVSLASMVSLFAVVSLIAVVPLFAILSLASPSVVVPGVSWLFFRNRVDCFLVLRLVCVPWLRV